MLLKEAKSPINEPTTFFSPTPNQKPSKDQTHLISLCLCLPKMRRSTCFVLILSFLQLSSPKASSVTEIGGNGGVGVWIDRRGISTANLSPPPNPPSKDYYSALQAWKSAITEDPSGILTTWVGPDVCSYKGIFCSGQPSSPPAISAIDLNRANLKGILVKDLSLLTHLSILHLNTNRFSGAVPHSFKDFHFLSELDLSSNLFSGPFPSPTLLIPNLIYLDLRFNSFSGEIPDELFEKTLDAIFLNNNQFEGEIPTSLWASPASVITLANNNLSGSIPESFDYMGSNMKEVLFLNNKLTGCIPEGVGYLTDVEVLDLSFNSLTGHLPSSISCLSGIEVLNIGHNHLTGELPDLVCELKRLENLTVAYNFFSGFRQDCERNVGFDFSRNCIPGRDLQRPALECAGISGGWLSCLRIPSTRPVDCVGSAAMGQLPGSVLPTLP